MLWYKLLQNTICCVKLNQISYPVYGGHTIGTTVNQFAIEHVRFTWYNIPQLMFARKGGQVWSIPLLP